MIDILKEVLEAEKRIGEHIRETPLEYSSFLSKKGDANVYLKLENFQVTGTFKIRGVLNKLLSLSEEEKRKGLVTASSGNHGVAFAYATSFLGLRGIVFLPENASPAKVQDIRQYGVEIRFYENDIVKTEEFARKFAEKNGMIYVPPYNDPKIIGGQGTIALELERQLENIDVVLAPVGGGGLISGIAGYLKEKTKNIEVIGVQPENSAVMYHSIKEGKIVEMESKPTLADGTAGGVEKDSVTFELCRRYVDDFVLVNENEIAKAIVLMLEKHHMLIEGAAALPVAAYLKELERFKGRNIVLVISGCRISLDTLRKVLGC